MFFAAAQAEARIVTEEWTLLHELAALNVELTHSLIRTVQSAAGGKPAKELRIPRPGDQGKAGRRVMKPAEFAQLTKDGLFVS